MGYRFCDSPEYDTGSNTSAKGDNKPCPTGHDGCCVFAAQLDVSYSLREEYPEAKCQEHYCKDLICPAKVDAGKIYDCCLCGCEFLRSHKTQDDDEDVYHAHGDEYRFTDRHFALCLFHNFLQIMNDIK